MLDRPGSIGLAQIVHHLDAGTVHRRDQEAMTTTARLGERQQFARQKSIRPDADVEEGGVPRTADAESQTSSTVVRPTTTSTLPVSSSTRVSTADGSFPPR